MDGWKGWNGDGYSSFSVSRIKKTQEGEPNIKPNNLPCVLLLLP